MWYLITAMWISTLWLWYTNAASVWIMQWTNTITDPWEWFWAVWYVREIWVPWADRANENWSEELLDIIKRVINRILWLLSLLALILCLRWWFQMLTAWWDDAKVKKWVKVLKNAAIWLAVIWFSRIAVSFVFRIIDKFARTGQP